MKHIFSLLILSIALTSCTKEVIIDFPESDPKTALFCFFTPDSVFKVFVNKTSSILDDSIHFQKNATVSLYENGSFFDTLVYDTAGWYRSAKHPLIGDNYQIKVTAPGMPEVTASDIIPEKTLLSDASYRDSAMFDGDGYYGEGSIRFSDNAAEKNYYELFLLALHQEADTAYVIGIGCPLDKITDNVLKAEGLLSYEPDTFVFSDNLINGMTHEMKLYCWDGNDLGNSKIIVVFRSISESLYNYKKKLTLHLYNQQSNLWNGVGQPVPMYSNINEGYGIFGGYSCVTDTIQIP
jgi:hypothetical protein